MSRSTVCRGKEPDGSLCSNPTTDPSKMCERHRGDGFGAKFRRRPSAPHPVYHTTRWRKLRKVVVKEWVMDNGWLCPGWRKPRHAARPLTVDHIVPLVGGGAPYDRANLRVLCRPCNSRKSLHDRHQ